MVRASNGKIAVVTNGFSRCGFGFELTQLDGEREPDVGVVRRSVRLKGLRLEFGLMGSGPRRIRGKVTAYLERRLKKENPYRGGDYLRGFGYCPMRTVIRSRGFRAVPQHRIGVAVPKRAARRIRRGWDVAFRVTTRAGGKRGATSTRWSGGPRYASGP
jgi:hypothetical protein